MLRPMRWDFEAQAPQIRLDVSEKDSSYMIDAEIPGVKKDDIQVQIDGNVISISAEVQKQEDEKKDGHVIRAERYYGSMQRTFSLGADVDESKAEAKYEDGVLHLMLPKRPGGRSRKLSIQ